MRSSAATRCQSWSSTRRLWAHLLQLPPRQRAAIVLRHYLDLSEAQAAEAMGCSVGAVKSSTSAGLKHLRERVGPDLERRRPDDEVVLPARPPCLGTGDCAVAGPVDRRRQRHRRHRRSPPRRPAGLSHLDRSMHDVRGAVGLGRARPEPARLRRHRRGVRDGRGCREVPRLSQRAAVARPTPDGTLAPRG